MKHDKSIKSVTEGSLFHYTKKLNTLKTIIKTGFRYSYSPEEHSERVAKGEEWTSYDNMKPISTSEPQCCIAVPMICFCDIPLLKASEHRKKYGNYCIGVNKELIRGLLPSLNPLLYCSSDWVYNAIEKLVDYLPTQEEIAKHYKDICNITNDIDDPIKKAAAIERAIHDGTIAKDIRFDTGFYTAVNTLVSLAKHYDGSESMYYNEKEWRVFYSEAGTPIHSFTREQFDKQKKEINKQLWEDKEKSYIKFDNQDEIITYIIVSKEKEIPKLISEIRKMKSILGKKLPKDKENYIKDIIISKITSFERIEADY